MNVVLDIVNNIFGIHRFQKLAVLPCLNVLVVIIQTFIIFYFVIRSNGWDQLYFIVHVYMIVECVT
jgi:hypothetical protein